MARIRRANVTLDVDDTEVEYYLNLGYNVIDDNGKVVSEALPSDLRTLQKHYIESKKRIAELEAEVAELRGGNTEKSTRGRKAKE